MGIIVRPPTPKPAYNGRLIFTKSNFDHVIPYPSAKATVAKGQSLFVRGVTLFFLSGCQNLDSKSPTQPTLSIKMPGEVLQFTKTIQGFVSHA